MIVLDKKGNSVILDDKKKKRKTVYPKNRLKIIGQDKSLQVNGKILYSNLDDTLYVYSTNTEVINVINSDEPLQTGLQVIFSSDVINTEVIPMQIMIKDTEYTLNKGVHSFPISEIGEYYDFDGDGVYDNLNLRYQIMNRFECSCTSISFNYKPISTDFIDLRVECENVIELNLGKQFIINESVSDVMLEFNGKIINYAGTDEYTISKLQSAFNGIINVGVEQFGEDDTIVFNIEPIYRYLLFNDDVVKINNTNLIIKRNDLSDMESMFDKCGQYVVEIKSFPDTSNVSNMHDAFINLNNIKSFDIAKTLNTSSCTDMSGMLAYANKLESIDVSGWDVSNVTNMQNLFRDNYSLKEIKGIENFNTSNVTSMSYMFYNCSGLTSLDLSGWDVSNVQYMFCNCSGLQTLNLSGWDFSYLYLNQNRYWNMLRGVNPTITIILGDITQTNLNDFNKICVQSGLSSHKLIYNIID